MPGYECVGYTPKPKAILPSYLLLVLLMTEVLKSTAEPLPLNPLFTRGRFAEHEGFFFGCCCCFQQSPKLDTVISCLPAKHVDDQHVAQRQHGLDRCCGFTNQ